MKTPKIISVLLIIAILSTSLLFISSSGSNYVASHSGYTQMKKLSKAEIVQLVQDYNIADHTNFYKVTPSVTTPYSLGSVRADVQQSGLDRINAYRRLAGLNPVEIKTDYTNYAQAVSVVNAANNVMSHYPVKPSGMQDSLYNIGKDSAKQSNIACYYGYKPTTGPISFSVDMWMNDSDYSNIAVLGHRRWVLNPAMAYIGFGCATAADKTVHTAMYAFDNSATVYNYDFVSWPPSGYMTNDTEFFTAEHAWNITLNKQKYNTTDLSQVKVTLKNSDGKSWIFESNKSSGFFNTDTGGFGRDANAIIFRPDGIDTYKGVYTVIIEGLKSKDNSSAPITFKVEFFSAKNYKPSHSETTVPTAATTVTEKHTHTTAIHFETTTQQQKILSGDATGDNKVTASDARLVLRFSAKLETPTTLQSLASDVTKDGRITASDARKILRVSAKLENFETPEFIIEQTIDEQKTPAENTVTETTTITTTTSETTKASSTVAPTTKKEHTITIHLEETTNVYVTPTGKKYHKSTCRTIGDATTALSVSQAQKKGYDACKVCKP